MRTLTTLGLTLLLSVGACSKGAAPSANTKRSVAPRKPLWLVITRPSLKGGLEPLVAHRRSDGFAVEVSTRPVKETLAALRRRAPAFILLVGDWQLGADKEPWAVPTRTVPLYRWRKAQRKTFASDALWGDLDGDGRPDVPVGRIPARTPSDVKLMVSKILAYERQGTTTATLSFPVWAGAPGYSAMIDSVATNALIGVIQTEAPDWLEPWIITGDASHPLCGEPRGQVRAFNRRLRHAALLVAMVGHGSETSFHSMSVGRHRVNYRVEDTKDLQSGRRVAPPVVLLTCSSGRFDGPKQSLAEAFLFRRHGPVAAIGATTESHPLTNFYTGVELIRALKRSERRIGRLWLEAQRRAWKGENVLVENALRNAEGKITPTLDLTKLRRDQERMYALLGDPATPIPLPQPLPPGTKPTHLDHRPTGRPFPPVAKTGDRNGAQVAFTRANRLFRFLPLGKRALPDSWRRLAKTLPPGTLRAISEGPTGIRVTTLRTPAR